MQDQTNSEQPQMTPEEFRTMQNQIQKELKEEIKILKVEAEYERLRAEIEESKLRRLTAFIQIYRIQNGNGGAPNETPAGNEVNHPEPQSEPFPKEEPVPEDPTEAPKKSSSRTLKKG